MSFKTFGANVYEACFNSLANTLNIFTLKEPAVAMYQMVICSCTIFDRCYVPVKNNVEGLAKMQSPGLMNFLVYHLQHSHNLGPTF